ncbi:hypothetical protein AB0395_23760 [Streptosporangium sp. NPDC051023]|uniref:hypothetical protein n=1 Tax=Streptosporangium sp. NPDC051023 TaxID=3155410 RepID=UPI003450AA56
MDIAQLIGLEAKLASQTALARGGELEEAGAVQLVRFSPLLITAEVDDAATCVRFQLVDGDLRWYCTCDEGRNGAFCAHCVATARSVGRRMGQSAVGGAARSPGNGATRSPDGDGAVRSPEGDGALRSSGGGDAAQPSGSRTERNDSPGVSSATASASTARIAS